VLLDELHLEEEGLHQLGQLVEQVLEIQAQKAQDAGEGLQPGTVEWVQPQSSGATHDVGCFSTHRVL
jgi:hypothetical protein